MPILHLADETTLAYDSLGTGETLLFLHGVLVSRTEWQPQIQYFAQNYHVISCDFRGHGESSASTRPYSVELFASDIIELLDSLGVKQAICCGHSFGGMVAQELALSYPERVRGLILADTVHSAWALPWEAIVSMVMQQTIAQTKSVEDQINFAGRYLTMFGPEAEKSFDYVKRETRRYLEDGKTYRNILQASFNYSSRARLGQIKCPTLILVGQFFLQTHPHAYEMFWNIRKSQLKFVPKAGHVLNWDNMAVFNRFVEAFLVDLDKM